MMMHMQMALNHAYYSETECSHSDDDDDYDDGHDDYYDENERQGNICAICCFPCCCWFGQDLWIAVILLACFDLSESISIFISASTMSGLFGTVFTIFSVIMAILCIICPICYLISTASCLKDNLSIQKNLVKIYWIFRLCQILFAFISLIWISIEAANYKPTEITTTHSYQDENRHETSYESTTTVDMSAIFGTVIAFFAINLILSIHWFFVTNECFKQSQ